VVLSGEKQNQFYIPEGFAHGFLVLSETAVFAYKCTELYHPEDEGGILWNDRDVAIAWPDLGMEYNLSEKDKKLPLFKTLSSTLENPFSAPENPQDSPQAGSKGARP
jgi:dTDP-4-dehydrorhamnose 3,5-epimerase